jgi:hypothetical protein
MARAEAGDAGDALSRKIVAPDVMARAPGRSGNFFE